MSFQRTVIIVAIVLLILCLVFIGTILYNNKYNAQFPPVTGSCPDYWVDVGASKDGSHKGLTHCVAPGHSLGDGKFLTPAIAGYGTRSCKSKWVSPHQPLDDATRCEYKKWASKCNVTWDGVTNSSPCTSD
jgi:hypothetical protein